MQYLRAEKILIVGPTPPPYHGVSYATSLILHSRLQGAFCLIHCDTSDHRDLSNIGKVDFVNALLTFTQFFKLAVCVLKKRPRIVYIPICQTVIGYARDAIFIFLCRLFGSRVIVHLHGSHFRRLFDGSFVFIKLLIRYSLKYVSGAIVLSDCLRYIFEDFVSSDRIFTVANGVEDPFKDKHQLAKRRKDGLVRVLFLSNLKKQKGYQDVLSAIPMIVRTSELIRFYFAGGYSDGRDRSYTEEFVRSNNLTRYINHLGVVSGDEKYKLLLDADIFVLPSYNEGQPFVIIEAMAAGLPIISTNIGAISEMVVDGENGFLVKVQNPPEIAEKILYLSGNPNVRARMGEKSRELFLSYYTKDRFVSHLCNVFNSVLKCP